MLVLGCLLDFLSISEKHIDSFSSYPDVQVFPVELDNSRNVFRPFQQSQQMPHNTIKVLNVAAATLAVQFIHAI